MGITWDKDPSEWFDGIKLEIQADTEEQLAQRLADQAREAGSDTVDGIEITFENDAGEPTIVLDKERIRRLANEILAS